MLNANYISLFGMQRVDVMIRQKFLNDLKDLQEINDCFRKESSDPSVVKVDNALSVFMKPRIKKKEPTKLANKLNTSKAASPNKNTKKEDPKNQLEKKTNANVYFWYYKDEPEKQKQKNEASNSNTSAINTHWYGIKQVNIRQTPYSYFRLLFWIGQLNIIIYA